MGNDKQGSLKLLQRIFQVFPGDNVQMVGWFIQNQEINFTAVFIVSSDRRIRCILRSINPCLHQFCKI